MGKTTLAHVVAQHCGYRPFEINASDDRSAPVLREKIVRWVCACMCGGSMCLITIVSSNPNHRTKQTRAMQSQAVLGDKRPNCIILDEVCVSCQLFSSIFYATLTSMYALTHILITTL